jgi:hypothetical protein
MKRSAAMICAVLAATPLQAQQSRAEDARAVIAAVLGQEAAARGAENGAETCVANALAERPPAPGEEDSFAPDRAVRIGFQWHEPPPAAVARPVPPPFEPGRRRNRVRLPEARPPEALAPALAERLNALRAEARRAAAPPAIAEIDLVPPPLHLQGRDSDCALLTLSAPAFAGDAAFVAVNFACGPICGNGGLYALERREGRWQVVAIADTWIR